jgi:hypothetical protein
MTFYTELKHQKTRFAVLPSQCQSNIFNLDERWIIIPQTQHSSIWARAKLRSIYVCAQKFYRERVTHTRIYTQKRTNSPDRRLRNTRFAPKNTPVLVRLSLKLGGACRAVCLCRKALALLTLNYLQEHYEPITIFVSFARCKMSFGTRTSQGRKPCVIELRQERPAAERCDSVKRTEFLLRLTRLFDDTDKDALQEQIKLYSKHGSQHYLVLLRKLITCWYSIRYREISSWMFLEILLKFNWNY